MGNDNWQFDVIASNIQDYDTAKFIHDDGSKTNFTDQLGDVFSTKLITVIMIILTHIVLI